MGWGETGGGHNRLCFTGRFNTRLCHHWRNRVGETWRYGMVGRGINWRKAESSVRILVCLKSTAWTILMRAILLKEWNKVKRVVIWSWAWLVSVWVSAFWYGGLFCCLSDIDQRDNWWMIKNDREKKNLTLYKLTFILFLNSFSTLDTVHVLAEPELLETASPPVFLLALLLPFFLFASFLFFFSLSTLFSLFNWNINCLLPLNPHFS